MVPGPTLRLPRNSAFRRPRGHADGEPAQSHPPGQPSAALERRRRAREAVGIGFAAIRRSGPGFLVAGGGRAFACGRPHVDETYRAAPPRRGAIARGVNAAAEGSVAAIGWLVGAADARRALRADLDTAAGVAVAGTRASHTRAPRPARSGFPEGPADAGGPRGTRVGARRPPR